jgi:hypothetical protein
LRRTGAGWGFGRRGELVRYVGPRVASLVSSCPIDISRAVGIVLGAFVAVGEDLMRRLDSLEFGSDFGLAARVAIWVVEQSCVSELAVYQE